MLFAPSCIFSTLTVNMVMYDSPSDSDSTEGFSLVGEVNTASLSEAFNVKQGG